MLRHKEAKQSEDTGARSGEDGLLAPLLGQDGPGFVLSIRVVGQLGGAGGDGANVG